jgi:adenylate kinase family enzyme
MNTDIRIGLVGTCGAGKTTLRSALQESGYTNVRHIAQEHSFTPAMWQRLVNPEVLVYLDVSYENTVKRRQLNWSLKEYQEQLRRLAHARQHADLIVDTNPLTPEGVLQAIVQFLETLQG